MDPLSMFILTALASGVAGGFSAGSSAFGAETANQRQGQMDAQRRAELRKMVDRYRAIDFEGANARQATAGFSGMANQIEAMSAARGTLGAGTTGARNQQSQALAQALTGMAMQNAQMQFERENAIAQLMSDPAFSSLSPEAFNPQKAMWQAALPGFLAGAGSGALQFMTTDAGINMLGNRGGQPGGSIPSPFAAQDKSAHRAAGRAAFQSPVPGTPGAPVTNQVIPGAASGAPVGSGLGGLYRNFFQGRSGPQFARPFSLQMGGAGGLPQGFGQGAYYGPGSWGNSPNIARAQMPSYFRSQPQMLSPWN